MDPESSWAQHGHGRALGRLIEVSWAAELRANQLKDINPSFWWRKISLIPTLFAQPC
jgi:hypothetical protein